MRDWTRMIPQDFDNEFVDVDVPLFPGPADDGCGTGDLLDELEES